MTHGRRHIIELLDRYEIRPSRALGQNFVADGNTVRKIARLASVGSGQVVIEVGAGLGSLTLALAETGATVTAIETDRRLLDALGDILSESSVRVIHGDALKLDWSDLVPDTVTAVVVANLPYNVGTHIVTHVLDSVPQVERLIVMVQREVGERFVADVGDTAYGALSVKIRYHAEPKMLGSVPATVFIPQPDVESALVQLRRRATPAVDPDVVSSDALFSLVKAGFGHRRKMLRRSLGGLVSEEAFECAGISSTARAEELDVYAWGRLAACRTASMRESNTHSPS